MLALAAARKASSPSAKQGAANDLLARAPKLREASERVVSAVVKGLQTMAGPTTTVEGMLAGFGLEPAREILAGHRAHVVVGTIVPKEPGPSILATLDETLVHGLLELFCGGRGVEAPPVTPRAVTPIDQQFAHIVFALAASTIGSDWADFGYAAAKATKLEGPLPADFFGSRTADVAIVNVTIGIFGLHGTMRLMLAPAAIERFAVKTETDMASGDAPDTMWSSLLVQEVGRAPVALAAYLEAKDIPLASLAGLRVGQILSLPPDARSRATLISDGRILYRGEIGQDNHHYSLRIAEIVSEPANVARLAERRVSYFDAFKV